MHIFDKESLAKSGYPDGTAYCSHRPILKYAVEFLYKKNGGKQLNILECGTGDGSGKYFSEITKQGKAKVWGIEYHNVPPACWYEQMKEKYENENYKITLEDQGIFVMGTPYHSKLDPHYDIIFVDTSGYENRANWVKYAAKGRCKIVILHDSEHMHRYKPWFLKWITKNFNHVYDTWPTTNPGTMFASDIDLDCNFQFEGRQNDMPHIVVTEEMDPTKFGFLPNEHTDYQPHL